MAEDGSDVPPQKHGAEEIDPRRAPATGPPPEGSPQVPRGKRGVLGPRHRWTARRRWTATASVIAAAGALAGVGSLIYAIVAHDGRQADFSKLTRSVSSALCGQIPPHEADRLTVENDASDGVWSRSSAIYFGRFFGRHETPRNAARWLPNCTYVHIKCQVEGARYGFTQQLGNKALRSLGWTVWVELGSGDWLPLAAFSESTGLERPTVPIATCG